MVIRWVRPTLASKRRTITEKNVDLPFFLHHLKDGKRPALPEALMFETGANRWRQFDVWPPKTRQSKSLYFGAEEMLTWKAPIAKARVRDVAKVAAGSNGGGGIDGAHTPAQQTANTPILSVPMAPLHQPPPPTFPTTNSSAIPTNPCPTRWRS